MKKLVKSVLGEKSVHRLMGLKATWFPPLEERTNIDKRIAFYRQFVKSNDLCFDVGANFGNRVSPLLKIGANVVAVEPQENCAEFLRSRFGNKITVVNKGLGENEEVKDFYISNDNTLSSFSNEWINSVVDGRFKDKNWADAVKMKMTTLDKLIETYGLPEFIKIDVEGYELEVLKGLTKKIKMISFEYTVPEQTDRVIACIEEIEKNNDTIECNYSADEHMDFVFADWQPVEDFKQYVATPAFENTVFGDVYVRTKRRS